MNSAARRHAPPRFSQEQMFAECRRAIDLIATMRARAIRAALFGSFLFRINPITPEDAGTRARWRDILGEQHEAFCDACALVNGRDPGGTFPTEVIVWLGTRGAHHPEHVAAFERMRDLTLAIMQAVDHGDPDGLQIALNEHFVVGRGGFFQTVTEFIDGCWADLEKERQTEVERANASADAIAKTLTRLESIGKHVKLVSLNASVEAARVGDAGRGLGVIATEFKTLAEEIQSLATTARADIATMTH